MKKWFLYYVKTLYSYSGYKLILNIFLMAFLGLMEGIGIIMLVPLLGASGAIETGQASTGVFSLATQFFRQVNLSYILLAYVVLIAGQCVLRKYQGVLNTKIQQGFSSYMRTNLYKSLIHTKWTFLLSRQKAEFAHVLISESMRIGGGTSALFSLIITTITSVIYVFLAFMLSVPLTLLVLISGVVLFIFLHNSVRESKKLGECLSETNQRLFSEISESLAGIKEIKSYAVEKKHAAKVENLNNKVVESFVSFTCIQAHTSMYYKIGAAVLACLVFYIGVTVFKVKSDELLLVIFIFARLWPKLSSFQGTLQQMFSMLPAFAALTDLQEQCLVEKEEIKRDLSRKIQLMEGIVLKNVSFRYNRLIKNRRAVANVNLSITARGITAFTGSSGAGKSTLVDLLMGLLIPEEGEILLDNRPLTPEVLYAWRNSIGYVPQDPYLFHCSIRENLLWAAPGASDVELWGALRMAAAKDFVQQLPEGIDTVIGERGIRLSGGERQRIVLARALLRKPTMLILDEATSSLDTENEMKIQEAIESLRGKLTIVIIAHRLSTIRRADQIVVLEQGRVVENGTYIELSAKPTGRFNYLLRLSEDGLLNNFPSSTILNTLDYKNGTTNN